MAEACGVSTFTTMVLNSDIISGVMVFWSTPFADASDFCKLPRWSIAAAAIMPSLFERAFRCLSFPGGIAISLSYPAGKPPEIRLRAPHVVEDLALQRVRTLKLAFVANAPQKFDPDARRRRSIERIQKKRLDSQLIAAEGRPNTNIRYGIPAPARRRIGSARDVHAVSRQNWRFGVQVERGNCLL